MTNIISTQAGNGCLAITGSTAGKLLIAVAIQANFDIPRSFLDQLRSGPVAIPNSYFMRQQCPEHRCLPYVPAPGPSFPLSPSAAVLATPVLSEGGAACLWPNRNVSFVT